MPETVEAPLFEEMRAAMASADELVWWLADLEIDHPVVRVYCTEYWTRAGAADYDNWRGWRNQLGFLEGMNGTIVSVGVDFDTQRGFRDRAFYVLLAAFGLRGLQKIYLNAITDLRRLSFE